VDVDCQEGTYIRSIAYDLGEKLGYGACLSGLIRTRAGKFTFEEAHTLEEIEAFVNTGSLEKFLVNPVEILPLDIYEVEETLLEKIIQLVFKNKLAAIAGIEDNKIKPVNVFLN